MAERDFTQAQVDILSRLAANNNRPWFNKHKHRYEETVRMPAFLFDANMADKLATISPHFLAIPEKVGCL